MKIEEIEARIRTLNAEQPAPEKKKRAKPAAKAAETHAGLTPQEYFRIDVERIMAALGLFERGLSVDDIVTAVEDFEAGKGPGVEAAQAAGREVPNAE